MAQSLRTDPWPPNGNSFDLIGSGFTAGQKVNLSFSGAVSTQEGAPAPTSLQADARGQFRLPLRASGSLEVLARSGAQTARLAVAFPVPAPAKPATKAPAPTPVAPLDVRLENGALQARRGNETVWSAQLPAGAVGPVNAGNVVATGEGTTVVGRDAASGRALWRAFLSGPVTSLDLNGTDLRAVVMHESGASETLTVRNGEVLERVTFPPSPALLGSLEGWAREGLPGDPLTPEWAGAATAALRPRAQADLTNPFLPLLLGAALEHSGSRDDALALFRQAAQSRAPFYALIRVAAILERVGHPDLADQALAGARANWAAAGYDPGFRVSQAALRSWGDPLGVARRLFRNGQAVRGGAWLSFLRGTMPRFEGYGRAYGEYAAWLDTQGRTGEAEDWRSFGSDLAKQEVYGIGEHGLRLVSATAFVGLLTLLGAYLALWLALAAKYWPAQSADLRPYGGRLGAWLRAPLARARFMLAAYHTVTEKLVLLTLLVLALAAVGAWSWSLGGIEATRDPALNEGTLGGPAYWNGPGARLSGEGGSLLNGLAAQLDRDPGRAEGYYREAPDLAAAQNNLGVALAARGDEAEARAAFGRALSLDRNDEAAAHNLGLSPSGFRVAFHNTYSAGRPMLSVPDPAALLRFTAGTISDEYARMLADPWGYLTGLPLRLPDWLRPVLAIVTLLVLGLALFAFLLVRPRSARYERGGYTGALVALLVPGSFLADEVWGLVLLLPWAAVVTAITLALAVPAGAAPELLQPGSPLGLTVLAPVVDLQSALPALWLALAVIYVINAAAWLVEASAARRRLALVRASNP